MFGKRQRPHRGKKPRKMLNKERGRIKTTNEVKKEEAQYKEREGGRTESARI